MIKSIIKHFTKHERIRQATVYIEDVAGKKLLDVGCDDQHLNSHLKNITYTGIDKKRGYDVESGLFSKENEFDYVVLLAVIEHINNYEKLLSDIHNILKDDGILIITTPKKSAERYIKLYHDAVLDEHVVYFTHLFFSELLEFKLLHSKTFEFGLNQIFVLRKI